VRRTNQDANHFSSVGQRPTSQSPDRGVCCSGNARAKGVQGQSNGSLHSPLPNTVSSDPLSLCPMIRHGREYRPNALLRLSTLNPQPCAASQSTGSEKRGPVGQNATRGRKRRSQRILPKLTKQSCAESPLWKAQQNSSPHTVHNTSYTVVM
jgi:hypothetical protein